MGTLPSLLREMAAERLRVLPWILRDEALTAVVPHAKPPPPTLWRL